MENLGVSVGDIRRVVREKRRELRNQTPSAVLKAIRTLLDQKTLEGRQAAYELLASHPETLDRLGLEDLSWLTEGLDNWASVDSCGTWITGQAWREGRISDEVIRGWARSEDRWKRRLALVSTVPLNSRSRGGAGDSEKTLMICGMLVRDRDDMVVKALSWALRELSKSDLPAVRDFLRRHESDLHSRVLREVKNKIETGRKA